MKILESIKNLKSPAPAPPADESAAAAESQTDSQTLDAASVPEQPKPAKLHTPTELLTPAAVAHMNSLVSAAVKEAIAGLAPILEKVALTPEKLAEAERLRRAPDPASVEREARERGLMHQETEEARQRIAAAQNACRHKYVTGQSSCSLVHNFPDRQPRAVCMLCNVWIHPAEWRIGPPDRENPRGTPYIQPAHPLYRDTVSELASREGGA